MRVWRWLVAALAWLVAVVVVATVAWFAIDSAGREVGAAGSVTVVRPVGNVSPVPAGSPGPAASSSASPSVASVSTAREVPVSPSVSPSGSQAGSASGSGSGASSGSPRGSPSAGPSPRATGGTPGGPAPTPPPPPDPPGPGQTGRYDSEAGELVVRCVGSRVEGWGVRPADGWRVDAAPGPRGSLVVVFTSDTGRVIEVRVTCQDGTAVFDATQRG